MRRRDRFRRFLDNSRFVKIVDNPLLRRIMWFIEAVLCFIAVTYEALVITVSSKVIGIVPAGDVVLAFLFLAMLAFFLYRFFGKRTFTWEEFKEEERKSSGNE